MKKRTRRDVALAFAEVLRRSREAAGLSTAKLADKAGLNRTFSTALERGARSPSLDTILRLAGPLKVPAPLLVWETEQELRRRPRKTRKR